MKQQLDHPALYPDELPEGAAVTDCYMALRPGEKAFVDAYLATLGESAIAAGRMMVEQLRIAPPAMLAERSRAMLNKPRIKAAIAQRAAELSQKFNLSSDRVLREVATVALSNMGNYVHITESGEPYIDLSNCTVDQMAAIQEITVEDFKEGRGEDARDVRRVKLRLHSKMDGLEKLMKYLQLYQPEQLNVNMNVRVQAETVSVNLTPEQLAEMYARKLRG